MLSKYIAFLATPAPRNWGLHEISSFIAKISVSATCRNIYNWNNLPVQKQDPTHDFFSDLIWKYCKYFTALKDENYLV